MGNAVCFLSKILTILAMSCHYMLRRVGANGSQVREGVGLIFVFQILVGSRSGIVEAWEDDKLTIGGVGPALNLGL